MSDMSNEVGNAADSGSTATNYSVLKRNWNSKWKPTRNLLAMVFTMSVANAPGLFWIYSLVDQLRNTDSAYWFAPTPSNQLSIVAQNVGAIVLAVLWFGIVFAMFGRPFVESVRECRR